MNRRRLTRVHPGPKEKNKPLTLPCTRFSLAGVR